MSINLEDATELLRQQLLNGDYEPGCKLKEMVVAQKLKVSRTIGRLAMSALEHEGLLVREPNRGSRTRAFTINEIADAIEVRGELEAMAARLAAERGISSMLRDKLHELLNEAEDLLELGMDNEDQRSRWTDMNVRFHDRLVEGAQNWALKISIKQISSLPLVSTSAIIFDRTNIESGWRQLHATHREHAAIVTAVVQNQGHRAEALMREHAFTNAQNKRTNLTDEATLKQARRLPGGSLVVVDEVPTPLNRQRGVRERAGE